MKLFVIEYSCPDCDIEPELAFEVIPKKKCPSCGFLMEANELEG